MEDLSDESKALYEILQAETKEAYEIRFLAHKEILDAVRSNLAATREQIKAVADNVDAVHADMGAEIAEAKASLGAELSAVKSKLRAEIAQLSSSVNRALQAIPQQQRDGDTMSPMGTTRQRVTRGRLVGFSRLLQEKLHAWNYLPSRDPIPVCGSAIVRSIFSGGARQKITGFLMGLHSSREQQQLG